MIEMLITLFSIVMSIISVGFKFISKKNLDETQKKIEREIEELQKNYGSSDQSFKDLSETIKNLETLHRGDDRKEIYKYDITYSQLIRTAKLIQSIGRASNLKEKQFVYKKLWMYLNSGLVNSALTNVMYNDKSSEIDKNSIVGMLVGDKIRKDTKSYIFIIISLIISIALPLVANYEVNFWLISFLLSLFSLLVLNQKVLEYRISNGFYGTNQYEAREIIGYIEQHSSGDDFNGFDDKKTFPRDQRKVQIHGGILEGLTS